MKTFAIIILSAIAVACAGQIKSNQYFTVYSANQDGLPIDTNGVIIDNCNAYPKLVFGQGAKTYVAVFKSEQARQLKLAELETRRKPIDSLYLDALNKVFLK